MTLTRGVAVDIVDAKHMGQYRLKLTFSDGHVSTIDFGPFFRSSLNSETRRFLDEIRFINFSLTYGNLIWGDYEMCFPVEDLYEGRIGQEKPVRKVVAVAESKARYGGGKKK